MRKNNAKPKNIKEIRKTRRKLSIRKKIVGTSTRPRVCAIKTNKNFMAQVVDDSIGKTIVSVQTFGKANADATSTKDGLEKLAASLATKMKDKGLETAVFDRNGNKYHGKIAAFADALRSNGIQV